MGILQITTDVAGQINVNPRRIKIITSDTLSTVTTAGYLNPIAKEGYNILNTDIIDMWYGAVGTQQAISSPGTYSVFLPSISNGVITLNQDVSGGDVLLPVVNGDVAIFNGTTGQIKDSSLLGSNVMSLAAVNTLAAGASIIANKVNGTELSNAVTASGMAGLLTTSSLSTAGGASYAITWTNTFISATSVVLLTIAGGTNTTENITLKCAPGAGSATLTIYNNTAATALNGTIFISYLVM